jgi:hypothetical protein
MYCHWETMSLPYPSRCSEHYLQVVPILSVCRLCVLLCNIHEVKKAPKSSTESPLNASFLSTSRQHTRLFQGSPMRLLSLDISLSRTSSVTGVKGPPHKCSAGGGICGPRRHKAVLKVADIRDGEGPSLTGDAPEQSYRHIVSCTPENDTAATYCASFVSS